MPPRRGLTRKTREFCSQLTRTSTSSNVSPDVAPFSRAHRATCSRRQLIESGSNAGELPRSRRRSGSPRRSRHLVPRMGWHSSRWPRRAWRSPDEASSPPRDPRSCSESSSSGHRRHQISVNATRRVVRTLGPVTASDVFQIAGFRRRSSTSRHGRAALGRCGCRTTSPPAARCSKVRRTRLVRRTPFVRQDHPGSLAQPGVPQRRMGRAEHWPCPIEQCSCGCENPRVISHAPRDYECPFCRNIRDGRSDAPLEVLYVDEDVLVKMN